MTGKWNTVIARLKYYSFCDSLESDPWGCWYKKYAWHAYSTTFVTLWFHFISIHTTSSRCYRITLQIISFMSPFNFSFTCYETKRLCYQEDYSRLKICHSMPMRAIFMAQQLLKALANKINTWKAVSLSSPGAGCQQYGLDTTRVVGAVHGHSHWNIQKKWWVVEMSYHLMCLPILLIQYPYSIHPDGKKICIQNGCEATLLCKRKDMMSEL